MGSLTPGKKANIIMLRTDRMNVTPLNDPATAVVTSMDTGNVDTVIIGGRVMKQGGQLLHVDWPALRGLASDSRDFVVEKSGYKLPKSDEPHQTAAKRWPDASVTTSIPPRSRLSRSALLEVMSTSPSNG